MMMSTLAPYKPVAHASGFLSKSHHKNVPSSAALQHFCMLTACRVESCNYCTADIEEVVVDSQSWMVILDIQHMALTKVCLPNAPPP